ncbi:hypothetical protein Thiowin_01296 [Thiorhodovibrio winogradskyi]|uniref:Uncharacterized protein n=1 Tax=Thiorhodovibrio winogradskyi TaxID=77007 RepID=A0ABZ0S5Q7_9GAMM|nr:hypothetical protein [Thiorhodovibrio winogradskyi]
MTSKTKTETKTKSEAAATNVTQMPLTVERVATFKTPDGKFFTTEAEALMHIAKAKFSDRIEAYITAKGEQPKGVAGRARNIIGDFLAWEESQK